MVVKACAENAIIHVRRGIVQVQVETNVPLVIQPCSDKMMEMEDANAWLVILMSKPNSAPPVGITHPVAYSAMPMQYVHNATQACNSQQTTHVYAHKSKPQPETAPVQELLDVWSTSTT